MVFLILFPAVVTPIEFYLKTRAKIVEEVKVCVLPLVVIF
jgi:hypothetical protein